MKENMRDSARHRRLLGIASALLVASFAHPAHAAPEDSRVLAFQLPCSGSVCDPNDDPVLASDQTVRGRVQLQAATSAAVGLRTVELQLQVGADWRCVRRWETTARTFRSERDIDTASRINGCAAGFGDGSNGVYRFRTLAEDRTGQTQASAAFLIRVNNAPDAPTWEDEPRGTMTSDGPRITLRWRANPEPDIVEYHFIRSGRDAQVEFAVSATKPTGQGCVIDAGVYECVDDSFRAGDEGTYSYELVAYRNSPSSSSRCALPGTGECITSVESVAKAVSVVAPKANPTDQTAPPPPPPPPPAKDPSRRSSPRRAPAGPTLSDLVTDPDFCFECGEFDGKLPYDSPFIVDTRPPPPTPEALPGDDVLQAFDPELAASLAAERARKGWTALAAGMILLALALQLGRTLRSPSRQRG